ncbi:MAG: glycoside hydrolase family 9 protein [Vicinamibacteria bacterium]|nr:glycoside hydrolase family 9 protein [Vicinamibacteria bacterium]
MRHLGLALVAVGAFAAGAAEPPSLVVRGNLLGYAPEAAKRLVVLSDAPIRGRVEVRDAAGKRVARITPTPIAATWGEIAHHYALDVSAVRAPGRYEIVIGKGANATRAAFEVKPRPYAGVADALLAFVRQQRCGFNPFVGEVCHAHDGRTAYGPRPAGSYLDARGGWHDAGDQLKYLLTSSTSTAHLLLAHRFAPQAFGDAHDAWGQPGANGTPDVLDEARWGLEWMLKLHPAPDELYHQIADDRDHIGWRLPHEDQADYGWGAGRYRVVYFADGAPQGLREHKSVADGLANLAGRYAAAMALGFEAFQERDRPFAERCLSAAREVYAMGRAREGVQQGNSYGAPYRYAEESWADDMEWGAAELLRVTGEQSYRADAERYARMFAASGWFAHDQVGHYQHYPFFDYGHFALHESAAPELRAALQAFYREGLAATAPRAARNPYGAGAPFVWCSANLTVALATQALLLDRMTGGSEARDVAAAQVDWLLGRNPWGVSLFTGIPASGPFPTDVHLSTTNLTKRQVIGGLVDGPVYRRVFESLKGVRLSRPDPYVRFQGEAVYHDDMADYSTNEPTLDGTAAAVLLFALLEG